ncbi:MAG: DegT/DnrJ/EryC1/StrS family aminotransferase [Lentisphaerae bacterium]|nr:DegT/DnrJ/EryC1/StrS family aminotransferase [Lentisphaerota bacterium]
MEAFEKPILVTRPYFPPLEDFKAELEKIWKNQFLTNNGPVLQEFQARLSEYLDIPKNRLDLFNNGTLALEVGLYALDLSGYEVITTPFTFVATAHAIKRIGAIPVFADIDPENLCLSPEACEKLITPKTRAIVPVHVYGHPCDVEGFEKLAKKYDLKIIYDAAHAFGVRLNGRSIADYGDMSMFSFHPTKLFHSCEGGLLAFADPELQANLERLRNFAILSETKCVDVGTNAKMNELQATMGNLCLNAVDRLIAYRRSIHETYERAFAGCSKIRMVSVTSANSSVKAATLVRNDAYCPVLFDDFETREKVYAELKKYNVFSRRYFYPLLTDFTPYLDGNATPIAKDAAARVLTLPTYDNLHLKDVRKIAEIIKTIVGE